MSSEMNDDEKQGDKNDGPQKNGNAKGQILGGDGRAASSPVTSGRTNNDEKPENHQSANGALRPLEYLRLRGERCKLEETDKDSKETAQGAGQGKGRSTK